MKDADIVVNLLPLNRSTHHFFDRDAFSAMKQGAWFANLGRGGTVDTDALIDALDAGSITLRRSMSMRSNRSNRIVHSGKDMTSC